MLPIEYRENFRTTILNHFKQKDEVWCYHPYYDNILVSSLGKIKNAYTNTEYKQRSTYQGYQTCTIVTHKGEQIQRKHKLVHRLVAETFFSYLNYYEYEVNHLSGNKKDNSIDNLNWLTRQENLQHARDTGLFKKQKGQRNGRYKYTEEDINTIDNLRKEGYTLDEIGYLLDITGGSVWSMLKRRKNV
jgi:predicted transcriptional regulator